jgi:hypothetical protein
MAGSAGLVEELAASCRIGLFQIFREQVLAPTLDRSQAISPDQWPVWKNLPQLPVELRVAKKLDLPDEIGRQQSLGKSSLPGGNEKLTRVGWTLGKGLDDNRPNVRMNPLDPLEEKISGIFAGIAGNGANSRGSDLIVAHQPLENWPGFFIVGRRKGSNGPVSCRGIEFPAAGNTAEIFKSPFTGENDAYPFHQLPGLGIFKLEERLP